MKEIYLGWMLVVLSFSTQVGLGASSLRQDSVESKRLVLATEDFKVSAMENRFRSLWAARNSGTSMFQIEAMDRPDSIALSGNGYNDISYELWETLFSEYKKNIPPFATLLGIGKDVGMRIRDAQGRLAVKVLSGENPYDLVACGEHFNVIHVSVTQTRAITNGRLSGRNQTNVRFFLVSQRTPDHRLAECALVELRKRIPVSELSVSVRNDPWFLQHADYPVVSPFLADPKAPTREEYENGTEWACGFDYGNPTCSGGQRKFQYESR